MTTTSTRPAVFFDRDGVLNRDQGYLFESSKFEWMEGAREAIRLVNEAEAHVRASRTLHLLARSTNPERA